MSKQTNPSKQQSVAEKITACEANSIAQSKTAHATEMVLAFARPFTSSSRVGIGAKKGSASFLMTALTRPRLVMQAAL